MNDIFRIHPQCCTDTETQCKHSQSNSLLSIQGSDFSRNNCQDKFTVDTPSISKMQSRNHYLPRYSNMLSFGKSLRLYLMILIVILKPLSITSYTDTDSLKNGKDALESIQINSQSLFNTPNGITVVGKLFVMTIHPSNYAGDVTMIKVSYLYMHCIIHYAIENKDCIIISDTLIYNFIDVCTNRY